jgi:hypothetical protein
MKVPWRLQIVPAEASPPLPNRTGDAWMNDNFRLIFYAVLLLTLLSGTASFAIVVIGSTPLTASQQTIADSMLQAFHVGIGTVFGLLGGRSLSDDGPKT